MATLEFTRYKSPDLRYSAALVVPAADSGYEAAGVYRIKKNPDDGTLAWTVTYALISDAGETGEVEVGRHRTLNGAQRVAGLDADRRIASARNAVQEAVQAPEEAILARLSSTLTVEETPHGCIQLIREHHQKDRVITLVPEAEDKLLALLLARKGVRLAP